MTVLGVQENWAVGTGTGGRREVPAVIPGELRPPGRRVETAAPGPGMEEGKEAGVKLGGRMGPLESHELPRGQWDVLGGSSEMG